MSSSTPLFGLYRTPDRVPPLDRCRSLPSAGRTARPRERAALIMKAINQAVRRLHVHKTTDEDAARHDTSTKRPPGIGPPGVSRECTGSEPATPLALVVVGPLLGPEGGLRRIRPGMDSLTCAYVG